ncbi:MAG TPA: DUF4476 domain-containing protein [Chitinophagaceae bacterium]|nr:DUF4476 domain-containing protein [Chitinophagaceae bacterium]
MKTVLASIFLIFSLAGFSQRQYFILVESENRQPIYVRVGETTYHSSSIGHVIISGMTDSVYTLEVGFPKDQFPSHQFVVKINRKDHGYQLKNLPDKGWVLFNFQTMELLQPVKKDGMAQAGYSLIKRNDGFAKLLSQVVNDTAVLYSLVYDKPVEKVVKSEAKPPVETIPKPDTKALDEPATKTDIKPPAAAVAKIETKPPPETSVKTEAKTVVDSPISKKGEVLREPDESPKQARNLVVINKVGEIQSDSGKHIIYMDNRDSVKIFIGSDPVVAKQSSTEIKKEPPKQVSEIQETKGDKVLIPPVVVPVGNPPNQPAESNAKNEEPASPPKDTRTAEKGTDVQQRKLVLINSDCKAIAWDNDVDKLRVKMLGEKDVDNKINVARKIFKTKCFTAAQIKGLTELFVTDQDKYKFLDAAYPFAVDTESFKELSYLLTDEYYVKRFRTMVRLD